MRGLEIDPELRRRPKGLGQQPCGLRRDAALGANELVDALDRDAQVSSQCDLGEAQRNQELLLKDLPGMCRNPVLG